MPKNPNAPSPADTFPFFHTEEPFKALSKRLGVSPNTLRKWWVLEFGQQAFDARGKAIQAKAAAETGRSTAGKPRTFVEVQELCVLCQAPVVLNVLQRAKLGRILCSVCSDKERGVDRHCPVCGLGCMGEKGLAGHMARPQHGDPEAHQDYLEKQSGKIWEDKQEGRDYLRCRLCGHEGVRIDRHLEATHNLSVDAYRVQFPGAEVHAEVLRQMRAKQTRQSHQEAPRTGVKRQLECPNCQRLHEVGLTFASSNHLCPDCRLDVRWESKSEPQDFVTCLVCGYRAESLVSHLYSAHVAIAGKYTDLYPGSLIVALGSAVRDKTALQGKLLSAETKAKMSRNACRWNAGLTKDKDDRVATQAKKMMGRVPWSKGHTKADHPSLQATSEKLASWSGSQRYWSDKLRADLTEVDFTPYLDETGAVDRKLMSEELGLSEPTITKYMEVVGLRLSTKYVDARAERQKICLERTDLERFSLANGKIVIAQAMVGLGHGFKAIKRECVRHGLDTFHHRVRQTLCLDAVSKALGGVVYEQEWRSRRFINPSTGRMFRFDGYFPKHNMVVEFHGYQHWTFPSVYIKDEVLYFALQERDRIKENLILQDPTLRYFLLREDEPYTNLTYLRARLIDEGYLDP